MTNVTETISFPLQYTPFFNSKEKIENLGFGSLFSAFSKTFLCPLERCKLILQAQDGIPQLPEALRFKNGLDVFIRVPLEQGTDSFLRGNSINLIRFLPHQIISLETFAIFFEALKHVPQIPQTYHTFIAGGIAGLTTSLVMHPFDFLRTRLALDMGGTKAVREFIGPRDCFSKIIEKDGIPGIYVGFWSGIAFNLVYRSTYFGAFYHFVNPHDSYFQKTMTAVGTTLGAYLIAYPLETIRVRMAMQSGFHYEKRIYRNSWHCFKRIFFREGIFGFYKGSMFASIRHLLNSILLVIFYEYTRKQEFPLH